MQIENAVNALFNPSRSVPLDGNFIFNFLSIDSVEKKIGKKDRKKGRSSTIRNASS